MGNVVKITNTSYNVYLLPGECVEIPITLIYEYQLNLTPNTCSGISLPNGNGIYGSDTEESIVNLTFCPTDCEDYTCNFTLNFIAGEENFNTNYTINVFYIDKESCYNLIELNIDDSICKSNQIGQLDLMIRDFYKLQAFDLQQIIKSSNAKAFFGLFKKSINELEIIQDLELLLFKLIAIHHEKIDDAMAECCGCKLSKSPRYYIYKHNIECFIKKFQCSGINIIPYLTAFNLHKVYRYELIQQLGVIQLEPYFAFHNEDEFAICPETLPTISVPPLECCQDPEPEPVPTPCEEVECCIPYEQPRESDWILNQIESYEPCLPCHHCHTFNPEEIEDCFFTFNEEELLECDALYTYNLNEQIC